MKHCIIFAGAEIKDYSKIQNIENSYIICADAGYKHAKQLEIVPDCILGDFDSLTEEITAETEILRFPPEKDDTDTVIAVKKAMERGYFDITLYGALGGRLDHTFANIQTLQYIIELGGKGEIIGDTDYVTIQTEELRTYYKTDLYKYFSVFSLSSESTITLKGFKYEVENARLSNHFPLGVSNEIINDFGQIAIKKGELLIVFSKDTHKI